MVSNGGMPPLHFPPLFVKWSRQMEPRLGGPGQLPARGSRGPVRARISAYGSSSHGFATCRCFQGTALPLASDRLSNGLGRSHRHALGARRVPSPGFAIRHRCGDTFGDDSASDVVPGAGPMFRRPPSLRRVAIEDDCPGFTGTIRTLRLPAALPASTSFPSSDGTTVASEVSLPCGR